MVSRSCSGWELTSRMWVSGGGSQSVLRKALAACGIIRSASKRIANFFPPLQRAHPDFLFQFADLIDEEAA